MSSYHLVLGTACTVQRSTLFPSVAVGEFDYTVPGPEIYNFFHAQRSSMLTSTQI